MLRWAAAGFGGMTALALAYLVVPPLAQSTAIKTRVSSPGPLGLPMEREEGSGTARFAQTGLGAGSPARSAQTNGAATPIMPVADISDVKRAGSQRWTLRIVDPYETGGSPGSYRTSGASVGPALIRRIQNEIRRVGCGAVKVTGYWSNRTKTAMRRFVTNRNAALPTNKPDVVLLSLLRTYKGNACGRGCNGTWSSDGQCRQIEASLGSKNPGLKAAPKVVTAPPPRSVVSGWAGRTTISANGPPPVSTASGTGHIVTNGPYGSVPTARTTQGQVTAPAAIGEGRMALGVPSPYQGHRRQIPPVTVQSRTYVGPTELGAGDPLRVDAGRVGAVPEVKRPRQSQRRQRKTRQRTYRKRTNWRTKIYTHNLDTN